MKVAKTIADEHTIASLSGAHKVTVLLIAMGKPLSDRVIRQFEDREIRTLARSATELPSIGLDTVDKLVSELAGEIEVPAKIEGSPNGARALLDGVFPVDEVGEIMGEVVGGPPKLIWKKLGGIADEKLAAFISSEQPQVAAYVISKLDPEKASTIMEKLEPELQADLSVRLVALKPISDSAARLLGERLSSELFGAEGNQDEPDNHARLASILNRLDRSKSEAILDRLQTERPIDARKVKKFVFSFHDVAKLTLEDRARLFDETSTERTVMALRDCDPELAAQVLASLGSRARRLVDSELSMPVKVPRKLVDEAQRAIAALALDLADRSVISLPAEVDQASVSQE